MLLLVWMRILHAVAGDAALFPVLTSLALLELKNAELALKQRRGPNLPRPRRLRFALL